jgi:FSR family fosmidomycin resistance protein-like MFS transporter
MVVAHASQAQRGFGMSFFSAGGNLGSAIGPIIAAGLLGWFQLRGTLAMVVPCLLTAAAVYAWRHELVTPVLRGAPKTKPESAPVPWKRLSVLCLLITLRSWASSGLVIFLPLLLHEEGVSLPVTARVLFVFLFCGALGGLLGGHLSDRVGRMQIIATSLLLFPFLMALALLTGGPLGWIILALAGMALLGSYSVTVVFAQEMLPGNLGVASGLTFGLSFGAGGVGVALSGIMADLFGLLPSVWMLLVLPGIAGLLALSLASGHSVERL